MKQLVLFCLLLAAVAQAQPPIATNTDGIFDFEDGRTIFSTLGEDGKMSLDTDPKNVKSGRASLRFDYNVAANKLNALLKTGQAGEAARIKSFRFWVKSDYATNFVMVLQEQDSGRFTALFHAPKNQWQRVELSLDDFELSSGADDPKDNNGKLDMDLVTAAAIADFKQIFSGTADENMKKLLGIKTGPHTFWLDDFEASKEALPPAPREPLGAVMLDDFVHPQLNWMMLGDMLIKRVTEAQLKEQGPAVSVIGQGLQAEYRQQAGSLVGINQNISARLAQRYDRAAFCRCHRAAHGFADSTRRNQRRQIQYDSGTCPPTKSLPKCALCRCSFEPAEDSKDDNNRLDLEQVKQILFVDATGLLGGPVADNVLWLSKLRVEKNAP